MVAFEDFRRLIILYYDANLISDEDFVLFTTCFRREIQVFLTTNTLALT